MIRRARLRSVSGKRRAWLEAWEVVRRAVFARDGWVCQARSVGQEWGIPCWGRLDPHHTEKRSQIAPERALEADLVITLCRRHHDWTDGLLGAQAGRLLTEPLGCGKFRLSVTQCSKFDRRVQV